ncbi:phage tail tape measure protein [Pseudoxanthomonas sp. LH2527]|uniref:phage tail tape measure protein n=1 Tax=Pseudoxanthomonas sp. LH2527 TaxID=2923249 RepID=UPI001F1307DD|nr:phage tail tape measure protein [Pseudoxanthomonas sp. LH2527]MCH6484240.1 phage tail tape measure protein [Pseudoxanthomonas sp. LH2527]
MANNSGANLRVRISADLADIKQGLGVLRGELAKVKADAAKTAPDTAAWSSGLGQVRQELLNIAGAYIGIQTVSGGITALFDAVDRMDRIDELSQITGVASESLSRLAYAAKFGAVDIELLGKGITKLGKDVVSGGEVLKKLGIELTDAAGKARTADQILLDLASVFASLPDSVDKNRLAVELFGERLGPGLIPLLNLGRSGIEALGEEAAKTGNEFSSAATAGAGQFNDSLDKLKFVAMGLANETAQNLIPAVSGYANAAVDAGQGSGAAAQGGAILAGALKGVAAVGIFVKNVVEAVVTVVASLGHTAAIVAETVQNTLGRTLGLVAGTAKRLMEGGNPITVLTDFWRQGAAGIKASAADFSAVPGRIANEMATARDLLKEGYQDVKRIGDLFGAAGVQANTAATDAKEAAATVTPASEALLATIRKILGEDGGKSGGSKTKDKIDELTASTVLLQDAVKRAQEALDAQFDDKQIGIAEYYAKRVDLQQQLIDLQLEQLQGELAVTKELGKRRQLEEQITILQRDRAEVAITAAREQRKAEDELNKTKLEGYRDQFSNLTGSLSAAEGSISAQMDAGTLGYVEGERRLQEIRFQTLEQLRALREQQLAYVASLAPGDPNMTAARDGLLGIDTAIANVTASMQQLKQGAQDAGVSALNNFFTNVRDGALTAAESVRQLVADFAKGIYDMAAQAASKRLASAIANMFSSGEGNAEDASQGAAKLSSAAAATTIAGGVISYGANQLSKSATELSAAATLLMIANSMSSYGAAHSGGTVGSLRLTRNNINPMVFGAAPRYHGGGVAGLQHDEIPAILKRGEIVRTREQENALQARMNAGQGGSAQPTRVVVVFSEDELANALAGAAGEKVVVAHARNNLGAINGA